MRAYKLLSIMAVAMLIACPLLSMATDDSSADTGDKTENGYYFEVTGTYDNFGKLFTDKGYQFLVGEIAAAALAHLLSTNAMNIFFDLTTTQIKFDSFTVRMGEYGCVVEGEKIYNLKPVTIELKNAEITFTASKDSSVAIAIINTMVDEASQFIDDNLTLSVTKGDTMVMKGDFSVSSAFYIDNTYEAIKDGYVCASEKSTDVSKFSMNSTVRFMNYDVDVTLTIGGKDFDLKKTFVSVPVADFDVYFRSSGEKTKDSTIGVKFSDLRIQFTESIFIGNEDDSCAGKTTMDFSDDIKATIEIMSLVLKSTPWYATDEAFTEAVKSVKAISITDYIDDGEANTPESAKEAIEKLGGKCTLVASEAKKRCEALNNEILFGVSVSDSTNVVLVAIIAAVAISVCAFGIVLIGIRKP